ncbi:MAG TPA: ABC transporter substrate-binding protein, partial [Alphaproteobacteria bacterium]|nr:ABC transporter substrate-binding protein [Alphaproteobacteria bacterium]
MIATVVLLAAGWLGAMPALAGTTVSHGMSLFGELKYPEGFKHFDYVNPDAPRGGTVKLEAIGTFDTLNPFVIRGSAAQSLGLIYDTLLEPAQDEPSSEYGLIAKSVEVPDDLSW